MCRRCRDTAIDDAENGQAILIEVRAALSRMGMNVDEAAIPLQLVAQDELAQRSAKPPHLSPTGMTCQRKTSENGHIIERQVEAILVLYGLPREHFATVMAHELGHVFLFMNGFPELEPMVEEGLCRLAEYLWLSLQKTPEATYRLKSIQEADDPIYGDGYRAACRSLGRLSLLPDLLKYVRENRIFLP